MPSGDKLLNANGHNGQCPGRFRKSFGVRVKRRYYYPAVDPFPPKRMRLSIERFAKRRRTAQSIAKDAKEVRAARREGKSLVAVDALAIKSGITGYSLFLAPSPEYKLRYPILGHLWKIGPAALPYDTMHLVLSNVTQRLWELFSGTFGIMSTTPEPYI